MVFGDADGEEGGVEGGEEVGGMVAIVKAQGYYKNLESRCFGLSGGQATGL